MEQAALRVKRWAGGVGDGFLRWRSRGHALEAPVFLLHMMKTGGTALSFHLRPFARKSLIYPSLDRYFADKPSYFDSRELIARAPALQSMELIHGHYRFHTTRHFPQHRVVTFLREPEGRVVSHLGQYRRQSRYAASTGEEIYESEYKHIDNWQTRFLTAPKYEELIVSGQYGDEQEEILRVAVENLKSCFFVGLHEQYEASVAKLVEKLGVKAMPSSMRLNQTPSSRRVSASPLLRQQIASRNQLDAELVSRATQLFQAGWWSNSSKNESGLKR